MEKTRLCRLTEAFANLGFAREGFWAVADQSTVSLGNFLTNIVLARTLAPNQYGTYAILLSILLFFCTIHGALVTYPLSLHGAAESRESLKQLTGFSLGLSILIGTVLSGPLVVVCTILDTTTLGLWAAAALFFWIVQETTRKALITHMRYRDAIWGDAVSYLGQAAIVAALVTWAQLSPGRVFAGMALSSFLAAVLQLSQVGVRRPYWHSARGMLRSFWKPGRWLAFNSLLSVLSVQLFPWLLGAWRGLSEAGAFQALGNILGMTNPILLSTINLILPASAKAWQEKDTKKASRVATVYGAQGALLILPYFAIVLFWPRAVLSLFYGSGSLYLTFTTSLRVLVAASAINYLAVVMATLVNALERSRTSFIALLFSAISSIVIGTALIAWIGVVGAALAAMLGALIRAMVLGDSLRRRNVDVRYVTSECTQLL